MNLSVGIVGLPNVGKSTLFNALLQKQVALAANYPFATIDPNIGVVPVPDERLPQLAQVVHTEKQVPALVEFVDIAGLVKGAAEGAGLGNKFLSHIRETSVILQVVRAFDDSNIIREGSVDPVSDFEVISTELQLADLATLEKQQPPKGAITPEQKLRWETLEKWKATLDNGQSLRELKFSDEEIILAKELALLTAKPQLVAINIDETELANAEKIQQEYTTKLKLEPKNIVPFSAKLESELIDLPEADKKEYLQSLGIEQSGLERLIQQAYKTLGLQSFYTAGEMEARAWTIVAGSTAPQAAGEIHTDFIKHFISAHVTDFADFIQFQGWKGVRENGKLRQEGRDYVMQPDDVVEFMIGK